MSFLETSLPSYRFYNFDGNGAQLLCHLPLQRVDLASLIKIKDWPFGEIRMGSPA